MDCTRYEPLLSDLIDEALPGPVREEVAAHLESCPRCRALVADLKQIGRVAGTLERATPDPRVWRNIRAELESTLRPGDSSPDRGRTRTFDRRWLAVAALIVMILGSTLLLFRFRETLPQGRPEGPTKAALTTAAAAANDADLQMIEAELRAAQEHYENAISRLEAIAREEEPSLDPQVSDTLRRNLAVIDQAISESRTALNTQPDNPSAQESLFEAFRRKVMLLQDTIALMNDMRKGDPTGAAQIAQEMKKS